MDTYNYYKLTNNSSRDLQIMPIEQQQHHIMNQIPTHDDQYHDHHNINPLFPNYHPQYYSSISPPPSSLCLDPPPYNSINISSTLLLTSSTNQDQDHDHDHQETVEDDHDDDDDDQEELGAMKEMMYKIAAMQPVAIDPATIRRPKRRNVRISDDPQSVAARLRRERISERMRILQRLVPGGTKMDTASMLDEAIRYVKFLKRQIRLLQSSNVISNNNIATNSPCLASSTDNVIKWGFGVPNKLGHGHVGSNPSGSVGGRFAFSGCNGSSFGGAA